MGRPRCTESPSPARCSSVTRPHPACGRPSTCPRRSPQHERNSRTCSSTRSGTSDNCVHHAGARRPRRALPITVVVPAQNSGDSSPLRRFDLTGEVALVTGGSRGLGREMVLAFAACGADVVVSSRKIDACKAVCREVESGTGSKALPFACNVGVWDELEPLVEAAYSEFGRVDILVNNAGMSLLYEKVTDVTEAM